MRFLSSHYSDDFPCEKLRIVEIFPFNGNVNAPQPTHNDFLYISNIVKCRYKVVAAKST